MKKNILLIIISIAIIILGTTMILSTDEPIVEERAKIEDAFVVYIDTEQLLTKGALDKYVTPEQRDILTSYVTAGISSEDTSAHIDTILNNINHSGIDCTKPIYGYYDEANNGFVFIAEVGSVEAVDTSINALSTLLNRNLKIENSKEDRVCIISPEVAVAYNNERLALIINAEERLSATLSDALSRRLADLSIFENSDISLYFDAQKMANIGISYIDKQIEELNKSIATHGEEYTKRCTAELNEQRSIITEWSSNFGEEAYLLTSLTFEQGRATLDCKARGINIPEERAILTPSDDNHLNYFNKDALAIFNVSADGTRVSSAISTFVNSPFAKLLNLNTGNQSRMILSILCDAIESIYGDTTIIIESIDGKFANKMDYYRGKVVSEPVISDIKSAVVMDVTDSYIISNVGQYSMGLLRKVGDNHYVGGFGNLNINIEQNEGLLFAGVNMKPEDVKTPATEAEWAEQVKGSYYYWVVNADCLTEGKFTREFTKRIIDDMILAEYRAMCNALIDMCSYLYSTSHEPLCNQTVIIFDNKDVNSLEQVSSIVVPIVTDKLTREILK